MPTSRPTKCYLCDSDEVVNESCTKCNRPYCALDASRLNPALYCDECQRDVVIEETTYTRTDSDYDEEKDKLTYHTAKCRQIIFKGIDWMFAAKKICELPDEELKPILNYHRAFVAQLESELINRNINKAHAVAIANVDGKRVIRVERQTKTKTVKVAKPAQVSLEGLEKLAMKMGINSLEKLVEKHRNKLQ